MRVPEGCMTITEAAAHAGYSRVTIVTWCRERHIGKKIAGRWFVFTDQLNALINIHEYGDDNYATKKKSDKKRKTEIKSGRKIDKAGKKQ